MRSSIPSLIVAAVILTAAFWFVYGRGSRHIPAAVSAVERSAADAATTAAVKSALALNKRAASFDIQVETSNRYVVLTGETPTEEDIRLAEEIARGTEGVINLVSSLRVAPNQFSARRDSPDRFAGRLSSPEQQSNKRRFRSGGGL